MLLQLDLSDFAAAMLLVLWILLTQGSYMHTNTVIHVLKARISTKLSHFGDP
jgi:hypothetical protein